ncbi:MAG: gliding motility-associated C-terminal domain-containing protein [Saprospiraceae bacterium]|nr:gliding motility-associated C-terminal domain-containing protein [Saprospiraceae bacterium]
MMKADYKFEDHFNYSEMKNLVSKKFYLLFLIFFIQGWNDLNGTHIVGGQITYYCSNMKTNEYTILLTLRRDCFLGSPEAEFDDPAHIGIFDSKGNVLRDLGRFGVITMPFSKDDTLNEILKTECEVVGGDVCVHTTTYVGKVILPIRQGGYILAYQRCCRNSTITNIMDPLYTGATYTLMITEAGLRRCNSGPAIGEWPPVYVCGDRPINFQMSAIDGRDTQHKDSFYYYFCAPYIGADTANSKPSTPRQPLQDPITFRPPYSLNDPMGGPVPLTINRSTGFISGQPNPIVGQYLIGVCVSEFDSNGVLLSITRRDFQYNVRICTTNPVSNFDNDRDVICDENRTVNFTNKSKNTKDYTWYFDYPRVNQFSKDSSPSYTFPKPGKYKVALIANRAKDCVDTSYKDIYVYDSTLLGADFELGFGPCRDSISLNVRDKSFDSLLGIKNWMWELEIQGNKYNSTNRNPNFVIFDTGKAILKLLIESNGTCLDSIEKEFNFNRLKPDFPVGGVPICIGESTRIIGNPDNRFTYTWAPGKWIDCTDCPNPTANPDSTITYFVTVTDGQCTEFDSVTVRVNELLDIDILGDSVICQDTFNLRAVGGVSNSIEWSTSRTFDNILNAGNPLLRAVVLDRQTFYLRARSAENCPGFDSISVRNEKIETDTDGNAFKFCEGDTFQLYLSNLRPEHNLNYIWTPNNWVLSGQGSDTITAFYPFCDDQRYIVNVENQYKCRGLDTVLIDMVCKPKATFEVDKNCDNTLVSFINSSDPGSYIWIFGDGDTSTAQNPVHEYKDTGTYLVTLRVIGECNNVISRFINVGFVKVNLVDTILSCNGEPVYLNPNPDLSYDYVWVPSEFLDNPNSPNPLASVTETKTYTVRISDKRLQDCFIERPVTVFVPPPIELKVNNDTILCHPGEIILEAETKENAKVEWLDGIGRFLGDGYKVTRQFKDSQYIRAFATDIYSCTDVDSFRIIPIDTSYEIIGRRNFCLGSDGKIEFIPMDGHKYSFEWSPIRYIVNKQNANEYIIVKPEDTTIFFVDFVNEYGCRYRDSFQVNISKFVPPLSAWADDDTIYLGQSTTLHVTGGFNGYEWLNPQRPPVLDCIFCTDPVATPKVSSVFRVKAINDDGCEDIAEVSVFVILPKCDETDVYIPNIFSPNGDQLNDEFIVRSNFVEEIEMFIYDRWGEKVFESRDVNQGWDGTYKGQDLAPDVYAFYFKVLCVDGSTYFKKGNVTLMR